MWWGDEAGETMSDGAADREAARRGAATMPGFADVGAGARPAWPGGPRTDVPDAGRPMPHNCQSLQRSGSFRLRDAHNVLSARLTAARAAGVITHSSGSHVQARVLAGQLLGVSKLVVTPDTAPRIRIGATRGYGAQGHFPGSRPEGRDAVTAR